MRWTGHGDASGRIDDGDGVAAAGGRRLVQLHTGLALETRGDEGRGCGVERESRSDSLRLLSWRGFGRVAGEG